MQVNPTTNQQALGFAIDEIMPPGGYVTKGPSFYMDQGEVAVQVEGVADTAALARDFAASDRLPPGLIGNQRRR